MKRVHWPLIALALLFTSCRDVPVIEVEQSKGDTLKENMINANRYISQGEEAQIDAYVQRRGWEMQRLLGGARVMESGERRVESGERRVESGERRVESGEWRAESGEWRTENGEWRVESGEWRVES